MTGNEIAEPITSLRAIDAAQSLASCIVSSKDSNVTAFDLFGRFDAAFANAMAISPVGDGEVADIEMGSDLLNLIPHEFSNLAHPALRTMFMKRMVEDQLQQLSVHGIAEAGRGPVIIMLDVSWSMKERVRFEDTAYKRIDISNAFGIALTKSAALHHRDVWVCAFNAKVVKQAMFLHNNESHENIYAKLKDVFGVEPNGGTDFGKAIDYIVDNIEQFPGREACDIVFFTDGDGQAPQGESAYTLRSSLPEGVRLFGFFLNDKGKSNVDRLYRANKDFFDVCVVSSAEDSKSIEEGLTQLYKEIIVQGFYRLDGGEDHA